MLKKFRAMVVFGIFLLVLQTNGLAFAQEVELTSPDLGIRYPEASGLTNVDVRITVAKIIRVAMTLLGIVLVVLILYAGFLWMTAAGNDEKVGTAKKIIGASIIGLAIVLTSYAITSFVVRNLVNATSSGEAESIIY